MPGSARGHGRILGQAKRRGIGSWNAGRGFGRNAALLVYREISRVRFIFDCHLL